MRFFYVSIDKKKYANKSMVELVVILDALSAVNMLEKKGETTKHTKSHSSVNKKLILVGLSA